MKEMLEDKDVKQEALNLFRDTDKTLLLDTTDLSFSLSRIPVELRAEIVSHIFHLQKQPTSNDALSFSQTYKDVHSLEKIECESWLKRRNPVIVAAIHGLSNSSRFIKLFGPGTLSQSLWNQGCLTLNFIYTAQYSASH